MKSPKRLADKAHSLLVSVTRNLQMTDSVKPRNNSRCCGALHVRTVAFIIAVFEIALLIYQSVMASYFVFSKASSHHVLSASVYALAVIVACVAVALLLLGILCHIPVLLVPHLLMQVLVMLTLLGMTSCAVYALFAGTSVQIRITISGNQGEQSVESLLDTTPIKLSLVSGFLIGLLVLHIIGYFISALINMWCFNVVMDCYRWLNFHLEEKSRGHCRKDISIPGADAKSVAVIHATDF